MSAARYSRPAVVGRGVRLLLRRPLPPGAELLVAAGDRVEPDTLLAHASATRAISPAISLATALGAKPGDLASALRAQPDLPVARGAEIAARRRFLRRTSVAAPVDGLLQAIVIPGVDLLVRVVERQEIQVPALLPGVVAAVTEQAVEIAGGGTSLAAAVAEGDDRAGPLRVLSRSGDELVAASLVDPTCAGEVLVVGRRVTEQLLAQAAAVGAAGLCAGSLDAAVLAQSQDGGGSVPVLATEGVGDAPMPALLHALLLAQAGRWAVVAVDRPTGRPRGGRLLIPGAGSAPCGLGPVQPGDQVRAIAGQPEAIGVVAQVRPNPTHPWWARVEVHLESGDVLDLPAANLEPLVDAADSAAG